MLPFRFSRNMDSSQTLESTMKLFLCLSDLDSTMLQILKVILELTVSLALNDRFMMRLLFDTLWLKPTNI